MRTTLLLCILYFSMYADEVSVGNLFLDMNAICKYEIEFASQCTYFKRCFSHHSTSQDIENNKKEYVDDMECSRANSIKKLSFSRDEINRLGEKYLLGALKRTNFPNEHMAKMMFTHSAQMGYAPAQLNLAKMYIEGKGMKKDLKTASRWLKEAATQGNREAKQLLKRWDLRVYDER